AVRVGTSEAPDLSLRVPGVVAAAERHGCQGAPIDLDLGELWTELGEVVPGRRAILGKSCLAVLLFVVVEDRGRPGERHQVGAPGRLALLAERLQVDVEVPLIVEVVVEGGEGAGEVVLE